MNHRFSLERYTGRSSRHACPNCEKRSFTLYVDEAGRPIDKTVGRCDHESSCGYHVTPRQWFELHPTESERLWGKIPVVISKPQPKKIDYIPYELIVRSQSTDNTLMDYLKKYWSEKELSEITAMYHLGSTNQREVIFPQISTVGMCHTGKIMLYDKDGHRIKKDFDCVDWLHSRLMRLQGKQSSDFNLKQVLFGEHLLPKRIGAIVAITESEKSAVVGALAIPYLVWVSCGGKNGLSKEKCAILKNRHILLYPDADAVELWTEKAEQLKTICKSVRVSDWYKNESKDSKRDIADVILEEKRLTQQKPTTIGDVCQWMKELDVPKDRITFNI